MATMTRYNFSISQEMVDEVQRAAAEAGAQRGKPLSVSEWIREAIVGKLDAMLPVDD